jgi:hypothetical protein
MAANVGERLSIGTGSAERNHALCRALHSRIEARSRRQFLDDPGQTLSP